MTLKTAFVTDFDGTISNNDFFWYVVDRWLKPSELEPWNAYLRGEISHLEALNRIFSKIHIPEAELLAFIDSLHVDDWFEATIRICAERCMPVYICSAGCDYYINRLIGRIISKYNLHLVTNRGVYAPNSGLKMFPPSESLFYDPDTGISKRAVVAKLQADGFRVVLAGDGPPDFAAAQIADVVFAKKSLLEKCLSADIPTESFSGFKNIFDYFKEV